MPRKYDLEFKIEAVRMASEPGITNREVERRLGIGLGVLSRWKRELKDDEAQAFAGKGQLKVEDGCNVNRANSSLITRDWMLRFAKSMTVARDAMAVRRSPKSFEIGAAGWVKTVWPRGCIWRGFVPRSAVNTV